MTSKKWIPTLGVLVLLALFFIQYCIEATQYNRAQVQIDDINRKITDIQQQLKDTASLHPVLYSDTKALGLELKNLNQKIESTEFRMKEDFSFLLKFGIPGTIIGLVFFMWSLYKSVYQTALDEAKEEVRRSFKPREQQIKDESKIAILTPSGNNDEVFSLLTESGFQQVQSIKVTGFAKKDADDKPFDLSDVDLILFNAASEGDYSDEAIKAYMKNAPAAMVLKFKGNRMEEELVNNKKVTSANFTSQLYGNLINMLGFKRSLQSFNKKRPKA